MTKDTARILIVDDQPHMRKLNEYSLRAGGFRSFFFGENGEDAVVMARSLHPDLIVIDLKMPKMDGLTALQCLKETADTAGIPAIIVSGCGEFHAGAASANTVANAVLTKPYSPTQLVESAVRVLGTLKLSAA